MDIEKDKLLTIRVLAIILAFLRAAASRSFNIKYFCNNAYAQREKDFEERRIVKAKTVDMTELPAEKFITETKETAYTRPGNPEFE